MLEEPPRSEAHEATKLSLELFFGSRGGAVAKYLDKRRGDRHRDRLEALAKATAEAGIAADEFMERVKGSDSFQELLEETADVARRARYEQKISYLGKVLANAARGTGGSRFDQALLRIRAVDALEPIHVQVLWLINANPLANRGRLGEQANAAGLDLSAFESTIGHLRHHGLIEERQELELNIEVENQVPAMVGVPSEATADTFGSEVTTVWILSGLGSEILTELRDAIR
jgi:hypothetical protein